MARLCGVVARAFGGNSNVNDADFLFRFGEERQQSDEEMFAVGRRLVRLSQSWEDE